MKSLSHLMLAAVLVTAGGTVPGLAQANSASFVYETEREFVSSGDFDADGRLELVVVDRDTGRIRIGYLAADGVLTWPRYINSGVKDASAITIGRLFAEKKDAAALVSADGNNISLVEVAGPGQAGALVALTPPGLGPNSIVALDIGGPGKTAVQDLFINTTYNTPTPNQATLFRNEAGKLTKLGTLPMTGAVTRGNRISLQAGQPDLLCAILSGEQSDSFLMASLSSGKLEPVATIKDLPAGSDYVVGAFRGASTRDVLFFKPGDKQLTARPVAGEGAGVKFGEAKSFALDQPIRNLFVIPSEGGEKLLALFGTNPGTNLTGAVFSFDGVKAPAPIQALKANEGEMLNGAAVYPNGFVLLSAPSIGKIKYSTRYQQFAVRATSCTPGARGGLPSLADTDDTTVPDIHKYIISKLAEKTEAEMKPYTNVIPGTTVKYVMLPIPGGEFVMGSPAAEKGRKEDEGPQHKVKIEPFWMEQFEVGWNEYELFMYRDEETKFKDTIPTDPNVDKVSDAVTRPSKPYVEMSFGMGKDGFPAIAMTHHAANKYCHWLSAKTGHFYRLPTEAEWEYACRAGTTTKYFFGEEDSKVGEYAWYEQNSDFKYQKVGKKKPNPWGLYDMYGNVTEWCLDQYDPAYYTKMGATVAVEPWNRATQPYPHVVRGGSWDETISACRSAARRGSERAWKQQDPQLPKSIWWLSDAQWVGLRLIRPLKVPPPDQMLKCWNSGTEKD